jgi:WD40 repeat protein
VTYAAWSPDGARIVTASRDDTAKVWRIWLTTDDLLAYAQGCCVVRHLTPEELKQFDLEQ